MTAGYSGTPQAKKLGLKPGQRVALDGAPDGWTLSDPPEDLEYVDSDAPADVVLAFFHSAADLSSRLPRLVDRIFPGGSLWIAWPRRAAGHVSDLSDNLVREMILPLGVVDVKIAAIEPDWSGQKVVWRKVNR